MHFTYCLRMRNACGIDEKKEVADYQRQRVEAEVRSRDRYPSRMGTPTLTVHVSRRLLRVSPVGSTMRVFLVTMAKHQRYKETKT